MWTAMKEKTKIFSLRRRDQDAIVAVTEPTSASLNVEASTEHGGIKVAAVVKDVLRMALASADVTGYS